MTILCAEPRVDARELRGKFRAGFVVSLHREDLRARAVADEEHAFRRELDDVDALERRLAGGGLAEHRCVGGRGDGE